jgi:serine/threonine protein kinase
MTKPNPSDSLLSSSIRHELDGIAYSFEQAWQSGTPPSIDAYLKEAAPEVDLLALKVELVHIDLENRLKGGETVRIENYFARYPELASDREEALHLIASEYKLRRRQEPDLTMDEFVQRFPQYREDLATQLTGPHQPLQHRLRESLICPHCRQSVTLEWGAQKDPQISCSSCGQTFRVDGSPPPEGPPPELTWLDHFQLLRVVGQGSFGTVYRARDTQLDRIVAVKAPRSFRGDPEETERFLREARNAAQLAHSGIVPIYEVGRAGSLPYIVSAFIQGRTLAEEMNSRRLGFREAAGLVAQVAQALAYAHGQGVIHRDLKPSNIMFGRVEESARPREPRPERAGEPEEARAFIADFGLARRNEGEVRVTLDGQILGTPLYMSPEQAHGQGHHADARSDVFSLGVILYEMLTGEAPFRGTREAVLRQIREDEPRPPRRLNDKIPRDLETIALKCLAKEPGRRYQTANDLAADLGRYLANEPILARPVGRLERTWRWARRNPRVAVLSGSVIGLIVLSLIGAVTAAVVINQERGAAVQAKDEAIRDKNLALKTLYQIVEFQNTLHHYRFSNRSSEKLLKTALNDLEEITRSAQTSRHVPQQITGYLHLGDIYTGLGKTPEARNHYEQARLLAQSLLTADTGNNIARVGLMKAYIKLGAISNRMGKTQEAQQFYHQALDLAQARAAATHGKTDAQNDLILALFQVGQISRAQGNYADARRRFQEALAIAEAIPTADPDAATTQEYLAWTCQSLGDLSLQSGQTADALKYFQRSLSAGQALALADPHNFRIRLNLAAAYQRVGDLHARQGQPRDAADRYQHALAEFQSLANTEIDRNVRAGMAMTYDKLNDASRLLGDHRMAQDFARKALEIWEDSAAADPENAQLQYGLAVALYNAGNAALAVHDFEQAAQSYQKGQEILQRLTSTGKLAKVSEVQRALRLLTDCLALARAAPQAVEDLAFALRGVVKELSVVSAGTVGLLSAPQGQGPLLPALALFLGRAGPDERTAQLLQVRTAYLARRGQFAEAEATAETLRALGPTNPATRYYVACCYAACAAAVTQGKPSGQLTPAEKARKQHYADLALTALKQAVGFGYNDVDHMVSDDDLAPILQEKRFTELVEDLKKKTAAAKRPSR